ncbi:DUF3223 domain-containing protein [Stenotrophomonas pavanii]|nr:DUF3223 domain-containing protein [Stenotrophomonas pavanii]
MAAKPVRVGERHFPRQKDALDFFSKMLNSYGKGDRVSDLDAIDLAALLSKHISYEEKAGVGVDHFIVEADGYGGQCFWVVRKDLTKVDFTYKRCVTGIW